MAWKKYTAPAKTRTTTRNDGSYMMSALIGLVEGLEDGATLGQQGAAAPSGVSPSSIDAYLGSGGQAARDTVRESRGYLMGRRLSSTIFAFARSSMGREYIQRLQTAVATLLDHNDTILDDLGQIADATGIGWDDL